MTSATDRPAAILVTSFPGDPGVGELERRAAAGERPRKDYVELARALPSVVIDAEHMATRASAAARAVASRAGLPAGQVAEAFVRRHTFGGMLAWADRLGLPLAALFKLARSRRDLVLVSVLLSNPKKAVFLERGRVHTHLSALVTYSSTQLEIAATRLHVPRTKLHRVLPAIDERFWHPLDVPVGDRICSVGYEARDHTTLFRALDGLPVGLDLAIGSIAAPSWATADTPVAAQPPANVAVRRNLRPPELRELYARSRFVVVALEDVEFDAGGTVISEAMAMGKAVIATRTRGQTDLIRHRENGLYVPPGDPAALREAIAQLLADPQEAERLGRAARALVEERQTLDAHVAQLAALLEPAGGPA